jgi:hypothetical protein
MLELRHAVTHIRRIARQVRHCFFRVLTFALPLITSQT